MFFPDRIVSIKPTDRVLEIGPGATPFHRSDVFLERIYDTEDELVAQSGHVGLLQTEKKVVRYAGDIFPFGDSEFDYVICSHVLEHVDNPDKFLSEIQRVAPRGYLEFPTIYYDFVYNFPEHKVFLFHRNDCIYWMSKADSGLLKFAPVQKLFYRTCELGYYELIDSCRQYFFQGFEWSGKIDSRRVDDLSLLTYGIDEVKLPPNDRKDKQIDIGSIPVSKYLRQKIKKIVK